MNASLYTLVWLILAPIVPGGAVKDQSVYFENQLSRGECEAKRSALQEFTAQTPDVVASHLICVPIPK